MFHPDLSRILFTMINFFILYLILRFFLFKPIRKILNNRKSEIEGSLTQAKKDKELALKNKLESDTILKETRAKGKGIIEEYRLRAEKLSEDIIKKANDEAQATINRAVKEIQREKEKAEEEVKKEVVELAILLSSKALEASVDENQHRRLINDFITKVGI